MRTQSLSCLSSSRAAVWVIRRRINPPFSHFRLASGPAGNSSSGRYRTSTSTDTSAWVGFNKMILNLLGLWIRNWLNMHPELDFFQKVLDPYQRMKRTCISNKLTEIMAYRTKAPNHTYRGSYEELKDNQTFRTHLCYQQSLINSDITDFKM